MPKNKRIEDLENSVMQRDDNTPKITVMEVIKDYGDGVVVVEVWRLDGGGMQFVRREDNVKE